jgi:cobalt-zinc-cadmium efflux system outer membrane protein
MRSVVSFVAAATLSGGPATAQEAVTESEFLAGFGPEHAGVRALGEDLARAEAVRRRATVLGNPRVEFSREQPDDALRQDTWTLTWAPPIDGRRGLARGAAQAALEAARERTAFERARLTRELRKAYADWSLSAHRGEVLGRQLALVSDLSRQARQRADVGEESGLSARRLELAASEVSGQLASARTDGVRAEAIALAWRPELAGRKPILPELPSPPPSLDPAQRPDIRALGLEVQQTGLEARLAGRFWTAPELQAGWQRLDDRGRAQTGPVLGFAWSVPLFDRNQAGRVEAQRRREIAEARLSLATQRAARESTALLEAYRLAAAAAEESARQTNDADRLVEAARASFRAGEATLTDLLETLRAVREARLRAIDLRAAALELHRELEIGMPPAGPGGGQR